MGECIPHPTSRIYPWWLNLLMYLPVRPIVEWNYINNSHSVHFFFFFLISYVFCNTYLLPLTFSSVTLHGRKSDAFPDPGCATVGYMSNAIGSRRESNPSRRICHLLAVLPGHTIVRDEFLWYRRHTIIVM